MTKADLEKQLNDAIADFDKETSLHLDAYGKDPVTQGTLTEVVKHVSYALGAFKSSILEYLK